MPSETVTATERPLTSDIGIPAAGTAVAARRAGVPAVAADQAPASSMLNFIAMAVTNPDVDVAKLEALLRMQREVAADDAKAQFFRALHACQSEMPRVKKNGTIDLGEKDGKARGSIPFSSWEDVDKFTRPIRERHGFSITFSQPEKTEKGLRFVATHRHVAGHADQNEITVPPDAGAGRNALQAVGSSNSYIKRYLTENFFNIVREGADDDGKRGGTVYITAEQVAGITANLAKRKIPESDFLRAMGVDSVAEIEAKDFEEAKKTILSYKQRAA
jgi:hypothetical protein